MLPLPVTSNQPHAYGVDSESPSLGVLIRMLNGLKVSQYRYSRQRAEAAAASNIFQASAFLLEPKRI